MEKVRGKFVVQSIETFSYGGKTVKFATQYDQTIPEDQRFAQATPNGTISMTVDNPPAAAFFTPGQAFYVDFTPAEPAKTV